MKKILIATTALVGTAGIAAAELNISGSARIGLGYVEDATDAAGRDQELRIEQRLRVNFTGIAETDSGVKLEARFRLESNENPDGSGNQDQSIAGRGPGAAGFAVSSGGFRLDVGNVSDVIDSGDVVNYYGFGVGFTAFLEHNSGVSGIPAGGFGAGDPDEATIKVRYDVGDFTVSASYSNNESVDSDDPLSIIANDIEEYQIGVGYNFGDYSIGLAYGNQDGTTETAGVVTDIVDNDFWVATFDGSIGAVDFSIILADSDAQDDVVYGGSLNYEISAATSIRFLVADGGNDVNDTIVAIGANHSLGGGVTLAGGVGQNAAGNTVADLGVSFSF